MASSNCAKASNPWLTRVGVALAAGALPLFAAPGVAFASPGAERVAGFVAGVGSGDTLILRSGRVIEGTFLEETETRVKFRVLSSGISAEQWFDKTDILKVTRAEAAPADKPAEPALAAKDPVKPKKPAAAGAAKVYVIDLKGKFGEDITQTPIRDAMRDAKRAEADHIILVLENEWAINELEKLPDDAAAFDELFRAEQITPIFVSEMAREWDTPPKVVFWVKQAMGGAAFLPFVCKDIYMSSEARIGGIGNLSTMFGAMGDEVVRQKQYSLRLGHAQGWAIVGGYEPRLITAMTRVEYVLSYGLEGGRPMYFEREPESPNEVLLTDDGKDPKKDTDRELVIGAGNDVLTLNADLARKLLVSRATVDKLDDLLFELGVLRSYERVDARSSQIMTGWSKALTQGKKELIRLLDDFQNVQVEQPGGYNERSQARSRRLAKLTEMQRIIKRFKEALTPRWHGQNGIPTDEVIERIKEQIRQEQLADKR